MGGRGKCNKQTSDRANTRSQAAFQATHTLPRSPPLSHPPPMLVPPPSPNLMDGNANLEQSVQNLALSATTTTQSHPNLTQSNPNSAQSVLNRRQSDPQLNQSVFSENQNDFIKTLSLTESGTTPKITLPARRGRQSKLKTPVTSKQITNALSKIQKINIDQTKQLQNMFAQHLQNTNKHMQAFYSENRREINAIRQENIKTINNFRIEAAQQLNTFKTDITQTIQTGRQEMDAKIENLTRKVSELQAKQLQSPWHDSRWESIDHGFNGSTSRVRFPTSVPPTLTTTTVTIAGTTASTACSAGTANNYALPPLSFATPSTRAPHPARVLQFNDAPNYFNQTTSTSNTHTTQPLQSVPNINTRQFPSNQIQTANIHKIIKSWDLKFPGKLDANEFIDEFECKLNASAINPNQALSALSQVFTDSAYTWFSTFRNNWTSWPEFATKFRKTFGDTNDDQQITNKIQRAVQSSNESGIEFIIKIGALYNKLHNKVPEKNQLDKIYSGLHSDLILQFDRDTFSTYDELIDKIRKYQEKLEIIQTTDKMREQDNKKPRIARGKNQLNAIDLQSSQDDLPPPDSFSNEVKTDPKQKQNKNNKKQTKTEPETNLNKIEIYKRQITRLQEKLHGSDLPKDTAINKNQESTAQPPSLFNTATDPRVPSTTGFQHSSAAASSQKGGENSEPPAQYNRGTDYGNRGNRGHNNNYRGGNRYNNNRGANNRNNWNGRGRGYNNNYNYPQQFLSLPQQCHLNCQCTVNAPMQPHQQLHASPSQQSYPWQSNHTHGFLNSYGQNAPNQSESKNDRDARRD